VRHRPRTSVVKTLHGGANGGNVAAGYRLLRKEEGVHIVEGADGDRFHVEVEGKPSTFAEVLTTFAVKHQHLTDRRTLRGILQDETRVQSLDDLPTRADLVRYISANGADAFGRLGQHHPKHLDPARLTAEDWKHLKVSEKNQVIKAAGTEDIVSEILQRK